MNVAPNILFAVHDGAPFVGDHVDDDNLLQKGHPLIMRLRQFGDFKGRLGSRVVRKEPVPHKIGKNSANLTSDWGTMAFAQNFGSRQSAVELRPNERLALGLIGMGVIFASLGMGEAVYRFTFLDFDGATDRLPIEMLFGLTFA
jgi:hypothetical protein